MAYQGYGQGADRDMIAALTGLIGLVPDLTLVLDVSLDVAAERLAARGGRPDAYEARGRGVSCARSRGVPGDRSGRAGALRAD